MSECLYVPMCVHAHMHVIHRSQKGVLGSLMLELQVVLI